MGTKFDISKYVSVACGLFLLAALALAVGIESGRRNDALARNLIKLEHDAQILVHQARVASGSEAPLDHLQPVHVDGAGVTINHRNDGKLILLSSFYKRHNEVRLIGRDGSVVAGWPISFKRLFGKTKFLGQTPESDLNVEVASALIEPDGSIVFTFEYDGAAKLSRCGDVIWKLAYPTSHTIEPASSGGYWIAGRERHKRTRGTFPPFTSMAGSNFYAEDFILHVSENGQIDSKASVPRILYDNGLEALLTARGTDSDAPTWLGELVHLNKVEELSGAMADRFPEFNAGELLVSLRTHNLIFVVDPKTWRIKWHQTGPWLRQHDAQFNSDGTISVFNNNSYDIGAWDYHQFSPSLPRVSNVMKVDPATGRAWVVFGERPGQELMSHIRGRQRPTPGGGFLITDYEAGRVLEIDNANQIMWDYINRYNNKYTASILDARLYPASYFAVEDWSCPASK